MMHTKPVVIGITGGVGAGKSSVLKLLEKKTSCRMIIADEVAKKMQEPGQACYNEIVSLLGKEVLSNDKTIDKKKMAELIYEDPSLREKVNALIHPAVNGYIAEAIADEKGRAVTDYLFIEAALLIECGYDKICDELWYVYAPEDVRKKRLEISRGYSEKKSEAIMRSQLPEESFRKKCSETIDNGQDEAFLDEGLNRLLAEKRRQFFGEG